MQLISSMATGYLSESYARSLSEEGWARRLPLCEGWILERTIGEQGSSDGMGCYPLFACMDWSRLPEDLELLEGDLVSISLVTDPFGQCDEAWLQSCFRDRVTPFKQHYIVDLSIPPERFVSRHHRRNARKAERRLTVEAVAGPDASLDEWVALYDVLIRRRRIDGMRAFSRSSFAAQLQVPGALVLEARHEGEAVGMLLWYRHENRAYYHLGAFSDRGYESGASFALFDLALRYFKELGLEYLSLGAGAGLGSSADDGLSRYKAGWSNTSRPVFLCGRVFDRERYDEIVAASTVGRTDYFPAYRSGEFA